MPNARVPAPPATAAGGSSAGAPGAALPARPHVVVCDVHGVAWRVLDVVPGGTNGGGGVTWAAAPAPGATGRAFIATVNGRKRVRVLDRHRTDPWDDVSLPALRDQLDDAHTPPPGWAARHARLHPVRSSVLYP